LCVQDAALVVAGKGAGKGERRGSSSTSGGGGKKAAARAAAEGELAPLLIEINLGVCHVALHLLGGGDDDDRGQSHRAAGAPWDDEGGDGDGEVASEQDSEELGEALEHATEAVTGYLVAALEARIDPHPPLPKRCCCWDVGRDECEAWLVVGAF